MPMLPGLYVSGGGVNFNQDWGTLVPNQGLEWNEEFGDTLAITNGTHNLKMGTPSPAAEPTRPSFSLARARQKGNLPLRSQAILSPQVTPWPTWNWAGCPSTWKPQRPWTEFPSADTLAPIGISGVSSPTSRTTGE